MRKGTAGQIIGAPGRRNHSLSWAMAVLALLALLAVAAVPAMAARPGGNPGGGQGSHPAGNANANQSGSNGDANAGDAWVDNVGQPPGPGHEMDPHLACADINLWGSGMADSSGTFDVWLWPPSGRKLAYSATWTYTGTGSQVMAVIPVSDLMAATAGARTNPNGFHFKLDLQQDPQKHKTFWVRCAGGGSGARVATSPSPTPATGGGGGGTAPVSAGAGGAGAGGAGVGGARVGGAGAGAGASQAGAVKAASTGASGAGAARLPFTGREAMLGGLALGLLALAAGGAGWRLSRRPG